MTAFFDTNVLVYAATSDPTKERAAACLGRGGMASVQVLNEFVHVARRKLRHDWPLIELALEQFRLALEAIVPITMSTHASAVLLARDEGLLFFDAQIVAAAIEVAIRSTARTCSMAARSAISRSSIRFSTVLLEQVIGGRIARRTPACYRIEVEAWFENG